MRQATLTIARVQGRADAVAGEIDTTCQLHLRALEQRRQLLLERVETIKATKVAALNRQVGEIKKRFTNIDELVRDISAKVKTLPLASDIRAG